MPPTPQDKEEATMVQIDRRRVVALGTATLASTSLGLPARAAQPKTVAFADGTRVPALGQGSWHMADGHATPDAAEDAMRIGLSLGLTMIDTAEVYSAGRAEEMIAKVIAGGRDKVFLVSKVWPTHVGGDGIERALEASLRRLGTDHLDLYLLHSPRGADLKEAVAGFERIRSKGLTKRWGVSNFSVADMERLFAIEGGANCATNQVQYSLGYRGIEADLVPWCTKHHMPITAYSPLGAGGKASLLSNPALAEVAAARKVPPAVVALAWTIRDGRTIALMESGSAVHVREDAAALSFDLGADELAALDRAFPPHAG